MKDIESILETMEPSDILLGMLISTPENAEFKEEEIVFGLDKASEQYPNLKQLFQLNGGGREEGSMYDQVIKRLVSAEYIKFTNYDRARLTEMARINITLDLLDRYGAEKVSKMKKVSEKVLQYGRNGRHIKLEYIGPDSNNIKP